MKSSLSCIFTWMHPTLEWRNVVCQLCTSYKSVCISNIFYFRLIWWQERPLRTAIPPWASHSPLAKWPSQAWRSVVLTFTARSTSRSRASSISRRPDDSKCECENVYKSGRLGFYVWSDRFLIYVSSPDHFVVYERWYLESYMNYKCSTNSNRAFKIIVHLIYCLY